MVRSHKPYRGEALGPYRFINSLIHFEQRTRESLTFIRTIKSLTKMLLHNRQLTEKRRFKQVTSIK